MPGLCNAMAMGPKAKLQMAQYLALEDDKAFVSFG